MPVNPSNETVTVTGGLVTNTDLCKLLDLTNKTVQKKLAALNPVMVKGMAKYYRFKDALPLLVKPKDIGAYIRSMSFHELPKDLSKEYWAGQKSKQDFLLKAGDLWNTNTVIDKVGELCKTVTMQIKLLSDALERESTLNDEQRAVLQSLIDDCLRRIAINLQEQFKPRPVTELPPGLADAEDDSVEEDEEDDEEI